jgi:hypothetical protein
MLLIRMPETTVWEVMIIKEKVDSVIKETLRAPACASMMRVLYATAAVGAAAAAMSVLSAA